MSREQGTRKAEKAEEIQQNVLERVIIGLCIVVIIAKIIAFGGSSEKAKADKPKKLFKVVEKILPTDIIKDNLNNHQAEINAALNSGIEEMNSVKHSNRWVF
ncbi:hypothetical protein FE360_01730 [Helicobacter pylori]|uniref:hypothetical protein n=1 Tax=Helicobacter pylori TaxID=210 RepID=UPI0013E39D02|nr:hypothetical protein [Helicobacter pylori]WQW93961.1 hypothetical protein FE360_01730 [Helicobacter pylori]WQZ92056.1 hypothetical protein KVK76_01675 [Helicobacter pylori]WQZ93536.1 hypothetical protein KVL67_01800 [Helicobacter pylori]